MASVVSHASARTKADARVEAELGRAVGRIRANDLLAGGLLLLVLALGYAAGMIVLDKLLVLPMAARQAALAGFGVAALVAGWVGVVRPLRRRVNPRFAARRVEETVPDAKNAVINWVDLQDRDLPPTVRAAVGQKAAGDFAAADVARATEARPVVWLGAAAGLLAATLAVLFLVFRPAPFASLVKRTFNPFVARDIATRTTLTLTEPAGGDAVVTAGESMTIAVDVGGSVPTLGGPDAVRVQLWHTADPAEFDELPLEPGAGGDHRLTLSPGVVQNGFGFRVVGGDARTGDHRVTVRSRPLVVGFEARYVAPAYTRIPPEVAAEPKLEGYRGTVVTLLARTNRSLKRGYLQLDNRPEPVPAAVVGDTRDTLQFELTLADSGSYRVGFTADGDETSEPTPPYPVRVLADQPPRLTITSPPADEVTLPADGTLAVDGEAADDFGLASLALRLRVVKPITINLQSKPYRAGKPFRRADGTFPTRLRDAAGGDTGYKETLALSGLKETDGRPFQPAADMVIEYWLEATDNCTEPRANVGESAHKTVRLTPAAPKPPAADPKAQARQAEQQRHDQTQDQQLQNEQRPPKQLRPENAPPPNPDQQPENGGKQGQPAPNGQAQQGKGQADPSQPPKAGDQTQRSDPESSGKPGESKQGAGGSDTPPKLPEGAEPKGTDPKGQPTPGKQSASGEGAKGPGGSAGKAPEPSPAAKELDDEAAKLKNALSDPPAEQPKEAAPSPRKSDGTPQPGRKQPAGGGKQPGPDEQKELQRAIDDLAGGSPAEKQKARDTLDRLKGKEERERIEKLQKDLASDDAETRKKAEQELGELDRETGTSGAGVRGNRPEEVERLSRNLNSPDPVTRKNAERQADRDFSRPDRDKLQQAGNKLDSGDRKKQEEAKDEIDQLAKKNKKKPEPPAGEGGKPKDGQPSPGGPADKELQKKTQSGDKNQQQADVGGKGKEPSPEQVREMADAARDLQSTDKAKQQAAKKKIDDALGQGASDQLEQDLKDLQSSDKTRQEAAQRKLQQAAEQAAKQQAGKESKAGDQSAGKPKPPTKEEIDRAAESARDLTSPDAAKRQAAEQALDKQMGPEQRQKLQQQLNDLRSGDPAKQQAAAKELEQQAKQAAEKAGQKPPTPEEVKELADAARDLNSPDADKRKAAEGKLDEKVGKGLREKLQQEQAARQPDPKAARDATQQAMSGGKKPDAGKPDPAAERKAKELAEAARDLASDDPDKKRAAEEKLDKEIGPEARKQAQQLAKDLQSGDPKTREAAERQVKDAMDRVAGKTGPKGPFQPGPGGPLGNPGEKYTDDPANRLKTAELQLKTLKEARGNAGKLQKAGITQQQLDEFLRGYEQRVEQLRQEASKPPAAPAPKPADAPPTVRTAGTAAPPKKGTGESTGGAGGGTPAPGFSEAQRRFAAQAAKGAAKPKEAPKP